MGIARCAGSTHPTDGRYGRSFLAKGLAHSRRRGPHLPIPYRWLAGNRTFTELRPAWEAPVESFANLDGRSTASFNRIALKPDAAAQD
jgi:hypothetical protein